MDRKMLDRLAAMMASENDADALMGLRAFQGYLREQGADFAAGLALCVAHLHELRTMPSLTATDATDAIVQEPQAAPAAVPAMAGLPQCRASGGLIEILAAGQPQGEKVQLPAAAAEQSSAIAESLKDAIVAAVINKSRMKLKLVDVKNNRGEVTETVLQAEYDRAGMTPVRVWVNSRGEVAALAAVLRRALANAVPDVMAA